MPKSFQSFRRKLSSDSFFQFLQPVEDVIPEIPVLASRGDRPFKMTFEDQLKILIFYHLEEHVSGRHMLQVLEEDDFARENIAPEDGIKKAVSRKPSTQEVSNNSKLFTKNSAKRHLAYSPIVAPISANLLPLMVHSSMQRCPCSGRITVIGQKRGYHLIARTKHGLMVQVYSGLITYLLLAIHCHENHGEPVTIKRVRELRIKIQNELRAYAGVDSGHQFFKERQYQKKP